MLLRAEDDFSFFFFLFVFLRFYLFLERGGGRGGEKDQCVVASHATPTGDLACNSGMCPDWELNQRPFGSQPALNPVSYTARDRLPLNHLISESYKYQLKTALNVKQEMLNKLYIQLV